MQVLYKELKSFPHLESYLSQNSLEVIYSNVAISWAIHDQNLDDTMDISNKTTTNISPEDFCHSISLHGFFAYNQVSFQQKEAISRLKTNLSKYKKVYQQLGDTQSQKTFFALLMFFLCPYIHDFFSELLEDEAPTGDFQKDYMTQLVSNQVEQDWSQTNFTVPLLYRHSNLIDLPLLLLESQKNHKFSLHLYHHQGKYLLLFQSTAPEDALTEEALAEDAIAEDALTEDAIAEDATSEEALTEDALTEDVITEDALAEEAIAEDALAEDAITEDAIAEDALTEETITEDAIAEEAIVEDALTEEALAEDATSEETMYNSKAQSYINITPEKQEEEVEEEVEEDDDDPYDYDGPDLFQTDPSHFHYIPKTLEELSQTTETSLPLTQEESTAINELLKSVNLPKVETAHPLQAPQRSPEEISQILEKTALQLPPMDTVVLSREMLQRSLDLLDTMGDLSLYLRENYLQEDPLYQDLLQNMEAGVQSLKNFLKPPKVDS